MRSIFYPFIISFAFLLTGFHAHAIALFGDDTTHDPSTIVEEDGVYWTFGTGDGRVGMVSRYSTDLLTWSNGPTVFTPGTWPDWINQRVPEFEGNFWAPDLIKLNGLYYLYYSAFSTAQAPTSAIGVAVTDSLNSPNWRDLGMVVATQTDPSTAGGPMNAIDPGVYRDAEGNTWMIYGSHYSGLYIIQINPNTGLRLGNTRYPAIGNNGGWNEFEGAQIQYLDGYYYAFVNRGDCCAGSDSNYYILVGRSTSPTGPFLDSNGVNLWRYGSDNGNPNATSTVLKTDGRYIGPGHFGYLNNNGQHLVSIHYYDGNTANGWPSRLDLLEMKLVNGWPTFSRNFTLQDRNSTASSSSQASSLSNTLADGRYTIIARHSGKALEVADGSDNNGANIQQWTSNGSLNQQFDIRQEVPGIYSLRAAHNGKSLDVYDWETEPGSNIALWEYWGGEPQQFNIVGSDSGYFTIISVLSGLALDVDLFSEDDGANVMQWTPTGAVNQQWAFLPADNNTSSQPLLVGSSSHSSTSNSSSAQSSSAANSSHSMGINSTSLSNVSSSRQANTSNETFFATVNISNDWNSGYCANLVVENTGATAATWSLTLPIEGTVSALWNGKWRQTGSELQVSGIDWNSTLQAGEIISSVGFCVTR